METITLINGQKRFKEKIYLSNGSTVTKTFLKKNDAKNWKIYQLRQRQIGEIAPPKIQYRTYEQLFSYWMEVKIAHKAMKTRDEYRSAGNRHILPLFGKKLISEITLEDGEILLQKLRVANLKNKTCNKIMSVFKQTLSYAELKGWLTKNPLKGLPRLTEEPGRIDFLNKREISLLLTENVDSRIYPILVLGLNTGMRIGEICGLWWDKIHFETNQIEVARTYERCHLQDTTKTHAIRFIPMTKEVRRVLTVLKLQSQSNEFVFVKENGKPYNSDHFSKRHLLPAVLLAKIRKVTFHILRHTFASQFVMNGGSIYDLQKILGHTDIKMTEKYTHLSQEHLQTAMSKFVDFNGFGNPDSPSLALCKVD